MAFDLDLPDWNEALKLTHESGFDCSPVKQPLAQATLKDGNVQRVSALGRPAAGMPAPPAAVKPAAPSGQAAAALPGLSLEDAENDAIAAPLAQPLDASTAEAPRSVRRTHTPSKTGLTSKAVRLPSRLGQTPGGKQQVQFEVPASTRATNKAAPTTGKNLKSILKRLNFSATKARAEAASAATFAGPTPATNAPAFSAAAAPASALRQPALQTTSKQLQFDACGTTPATGTAAKAGPRHVTFDASTVSPGPRSRPVRPAAAGMRTPEPTIPEEDSSEEVLAGGSVNSSAAGHTPYDRRLSSLFRKYQVAGTPELTEDDLDGLAADGVVQSPSWKRLSSASVPESIRELSKKYDSDTGSIQGLEPSAPSPTPTPAAAAEGEAEDAATPVQLQLGGSAVSPASMEPTPHEVLASLMKRNLLYESSPETAARQQTPQEQAATANQDTAEETTPSGQLTPQTAVARLLAPVLLATINEVESTREAQQQQQQQKGAPAEPTASVNPNASSPAEFYGFPLSPKMSTPGSSSTTDGVPRNADGIPTVTPATVTVRRGAYAGNLGSVLEEDDELAANLFDSFSPGATFSPGASPSGEPEFGGFGSFHPAVQSAAAGSGVVQGTQAGATPSSADLHSSADKQGGAEFSFFPAPAAGGQQQAGAAAGATPELGAGAPDGGAAASNMISPEILGFYESQRQAVAGTPTLPRSIIKSGRPLNEAGTPLLGHAQRAPDAAPPPTITKELQALMADLKLEDPAEIQKLGSVSTLSPVRATGSLRGLLGGLAKAITPVRRSARKQAPPKPLEAMLEETGFSYVPNAALMPADDQLEKKSASRASSQVTEPSLTGMLSGAGEQPEVSSAATPHHYSTRRSAARAEQEGWSRQEAAASRTPATHAQQQAPAEVATPQALPPEAPVEQDASPALQESTNLHDCQSPVVPPGGRTYSLRASTVKKTRQSMGGALAGAALRSSSKKKERQSTGPQLSPTEQGIRAQLRRSARKSRGGSE